jgi:putative DNA methylase
VLFRSVGASKENRAKMEKAQKQLAEQVQKEIDSLGVETDGKGWRAKVYLYCVEVKCPQTGWMVPLLPDRIISKGYGVIAELIPNYHDKRYDIEVRYADSKEEINAAQVGTIQDGNVVHSPDGITQYRINIKTIRGDYKADKENKNRLRLWGKSDFIPLSDDIFQERLYCVQWMKKKAKGKKYDYKFCSVTHDDLEREQKVINYVREHLDE